MRWFASIVIVALVAIGATPSAHATRTDEHRSSISSSHSPATLLPRRAVVGRGAVSDRRTEHDEVFLVPRTTLLLAIPSLSLLVPPTSTPPCLTPASIDELARGPPSPVVSSHPPL